MPQGRPGFHHQVYAVSQVYFPVSPTVTGKRSGGNRDLSNVELQMTACGQQDRGSDHLLC